MRERQRELGIALLAFVVALLLWQSSSLSPVVYPLRLFVTFIHELGHGITAEATGGDFLRFEVNEQGGGLAYSSGGVRELIVMMGYMGTALFGSALLVLSNRSRYPGTVALVLGVVFILLTLFYADLNLYNLLGGERLVAGGLFFGGISYFMLAPKNRGRVIALGAVLSSVFLALLWSVDDNLLTMATGVLIGAVLIGLGYLGWRGQRKVVVGVLNFLAFTVGLNSITDALYLLEIIHRSDRINNDATTMANLTGVSASIWAMVWITSAIVLLWAAIWLSFVQPQRHAKTHETQPVLN